jgi:hypothetical protein
MTLRQFAALALMLVVAGPLLRPDPALAQKVREIRLTERHIEGFIAAMKDVSAMTEKMPANASDPGAELERLAKKHGFGNFNEYDETAETIAHIAAGIDPTTKVYTDSRTQRLREIAEVKADKTIPPEEKKQQINELEESLKAAAPLLYPENVALVRKHFARLEAVLLQ